MRIGIFAVVVVCGAWLAGGGLAASLLGSGGLFGTAAPLVEVRAPAPEAVNRPAGGASLAGVASPGGPAGSLFAGRQDGTFFAPPAIRLDVDPVAVLRGTPALPNRRGAAGLRDLIASAEAGPAGYNAVVWSARIKTPKPPTDMTLAEIETWTRATPGQDHAIGRYQFIPKTLRRLVAAAGLPPSTRFSPQVQDRLADMLLEEAGYNRFLAGQKTKVAFMNNLSKIWAGLPNSSGKSHYHGFNGNKATMTWSRFEAAMARIFRG